MKLNDIKPLSESIKEHTFIVKDWDGNQTKNEFVEPFDVLVVYELEDLGHSDHPYGEGTAREYHGHNIYIIDLLANEPVEIKDTAEEKVLKTLPKGTKLQNMPGWDEKFMEYFQQKAEEHST